MTAIEVSDDLAQLDSALAAAPNQPAVFALWPKEGDPYVGKTGLLRRRRYGRVHEMQLNALPLKKAAQWVEEYRKFWEGSLDRLAEYLEKTKPTGKKGKI